MDKDKEMQLFETATEKLDLYVPSLLKYDHVEDAGKFLEPGGPYVRFAVKQFLRELVFELIRPAGEFKEDPNFLDMDPIFETVKSRLPEHFQVERYLTGYIYSEFINVTISDIISLRLKRGTSYHYSILGIQVKGFEEDDDSDWMELVAEELDDELLRAEASGDAGDDDAWFFPDQLNEFFELVDYVYENHSRHREIAEEKARMLREKYGF